MTETSWKWRIVIASLVGALLPWVALWIYLHSN